VQVRQDGGAQGASNLSLGARFDALIAESISPLGK
jgi:hypothetical protein